MDPELKAMVRDTLALARDNNRILRAMRRDQWFRVALKILLWAALILLPLYYLQPYLEALPSLEQFQDVMKVYQGTL